MSTNYSIGQHVRHPKWDQWGPGEILSLSGDKATINFTNGGIKTIDVSLVPLSPVKGSQKVPFRVDIETLQRQCRQFISDMEHNRRGTDDAGMARQVLEQMTRNGRLNKSTETRLLNWCYTDGSVFQAGVELARQICVTIYGYLLPDPDLIKR
jgi:hypothetical protein